MIALCLSNLLAAIAGNAAYVGTSPFPGQTMAGVRLEGTAGIEPWRASKSYLGECNFTPCRAIDSHLWQFGAQAKGDLQSAFDHYVWLPNDDFLT